MPQAAHQLTSAAVRSVRHLVAPARASLALRRPRARRTRIAAPSPRGPCSRPRTHRPRSSEARRVARAPLLTILSGLWCRACPPQDAACHRDTAVRALAAHGVGSVGTAVTGVSRRLRGGCDGARLKDAPSSTAPEGATPLWPRPAYTWWTALRALGEGSEWKWYSHWCIARADGRQAPSTRRDSPPPP